MQESEIPDYNIFMMCPALNEHALTTLKEGYSIRSCKPDDIDIWKRFPFDTPEFATEYEPIMTQYFSETYGADPELFFKNTLFVCDKNQNPVATCSTWRAYGKFSTIQWFKTLKSHEGQGIGRALFSVIMQRFKKEDFPIYLHTQPGSFRAIKLYADFGFCLLEDDHIGIRENELKKSLPILKQFMPKKDFEQLKTAAAPSGFIASLENEVSIQF